MKLRKTCLFDVFLRGLTVAVIAIVFSISLTAQVPAATGSPTPASPTPSPTPAPITAEMVASGNLTVEQIAELSIATYGFPNGRATLNQIRKTAVERGKVIITTGDGQQDTATYQRWFLRPETGAGKTRLDQQFPNAKYSLIHDGAEIFGVFNDSSFVPREDASTVFQNQLLHSIDAFHRYTENGSQFVSGGREKILGVDHHVLDMTDKQGRKTKYFLSAKSFRIMMLEYESGGVTYRRKFYDNRFAQGTLVPYRSVLMVGDKVLEEVLVGTITYGQKVDDGLFVKP